MGKYLKGVLVAMAVLCLFSGALFVTAPAYADSLEEAIQQGITDGKINKTAEPGFLGIPDS